MLKKHLFFIIFLALNSFINAQDFDTRLLKVYSKEELTKSAPEELKLLNYAIEHAIVISEFPNAKSEQINQEISFLEGQTFLDLGLKISNSNQYYKVKQSGKLLIVKSRSWLENELTNAK